MKKQQAPASTNTPIYQWGIVVPTSVRRNNMPDKYNIEESKQNKINLLHLYY